MINRLNITHYSLVALLSVTMILADHLALADQDQYREHDEIRQLRLEGKIVSLETIIEKAKTRYSGKILEAELEEQRNRYIYEIEILSDDGTVWELKYNATTADLLSIERDD